MQFLSHMRIGQRLAVSYALLILLLMAIGAYGAANANHLAKDLDRTANSSLVKIATANALEGDVNVIARASRDLLLLDEARQIKKQKAAIDGAMQELDKHLGELQGLVDDDKEKDIVSQVQERQGKFMASVSKFLKIQADGSPDEARESLITDVRPAQQAYQESLKRLVESKFESARELAESGSSLASRSVAITMGLVVVAVLIGGGGGVAISRSIIVPARQAKDAALAISSGDLSHRIQASGQDELGQMLHAMKDMQDALSGVVNSVSQAAGEVAHNSGAIANSNSNLSDRTARSAASLQNTAASVEQIAANLTGASELTRKAAGIAGKARQSASAGGQVVAQVVSTMEEISTSSRKIGDIIGVIDGIAFQTNILALNAAVEAARAGEQGRGFAVVASEVRNLATRSAGAAREIKALIQTSVERVQAGSDLARDAGTTMTEVVASIREVSSLMEEISQASAAQTSDMQRVTQAIVRMDDVTQQNAALVEESAAAAGSLSGQAQQLVQAVEVFRLRHAHPALPAPRA